MVLPLDPLEGQSSFPLPLVVMAVRVEAAVVRQLQWQVAVGEVEQC